MIYTIKSSVSFGGRREHLAVFHGRSGWCLQPAHPTQHGYRYDPPIAEGIETKRDALKVRRWFYANPGKSLLCAPKGSPA